MRISGSTPATASSSSAKRAAPSRRGLYTLRRPGGAGVGVGLCFVVVGGGVWGGGGDASASQTQVGPACIGRALEARQIGVATLAPLPLGLPSSPCIRLSSS